MSTRRAFRWSSFTCALLLVGVACGEDKPRQGPSKGQPDGKDAGTGEGDGGLPTVSPDATSTAAREFGDELEDVQCQGIFECCSAAERRRAFDIQADSPEEGCNPRNALFGSTFSLQRYDEAIEAGRLRFNEGFADLCLKSHRNRSCSNLEGVAAFSSDLSGCGAVLEPLARRGEACGSDRECRTGYCATPPGDGESRCRPLPEQGDKCPQYQCAAGLYCDRFQARPTCKPTKKEGSTCSEDLECRSGTCRNRRCVQPSPACGDAS